MAPAKPSLAVASSQSLEPDKVGNHYKRNANNDQKNYIRDKIRENHEREAANEGHDCPLPFAINKKAESN
jgi:hypothetical protein